MLELFLFAMLNLVKLLCTFFSYLFFIFTEQYNLLLNMCCLQVTLLASFVKTWRGRLLQCGYKIMCADIKLRKLRSTCSVDTKARVHIESSKSGQLSMKILLLMLFHWVWRACCWGFQAAKYGFEVVVGSKYVLTTKYKWDGLANVIFWKVIGVLDDFHVKLYGDSFWENSYLL